MGNTEEGISQSATPSSKGVPAWRIAPTVSRSMPGAHSSADAAAGQGPFIRSFGLIVSQAMDARIENAMRAVSNRIRSNNRIKPLVEGQVRFRAS